MTGVRSSAGLRAAFVRLHTRRRALRVWPWVVMGCALVVVLHGDPWVYTVGAIGAVGGLIRIAWLVWPLSDRS